jgi:hypothetical protein
MSLRCAKEYIIAVERFRGPEMMLMTFMDLKVSIYFGKRILGNQETGLFDKQRFDQ